MILTAQEQAWLEEINPKDNAFKPYPTLKKNPRDRRYLKHHGFDSFTTYNADLSILKLAYITLRRVDSPLAKTAKKAIADYWLLDSDKTALVSFWQDFGQKVDFGDMSWFIMHTLAILEVYKNIAQKAINLNYRQITCQFMNTLGDETFVYQETHDQAYYLDWLIERLYLSIHYPHSDNSDKFFLIWSQVYHHFWW